MRIRAFVIIFFSMLACAGQDTKPHLPNNLSAKIPVFVTKANTRVAVNAAYEYKANAFDSTGLTLHLTCPLLPAWLKFDSTTRTLKGTAPKAGQYGVTLKVDNGRYSSLQPFMVTVYDENTLNILALGNSITNGTDRFNSYRRDLWKMFHEGNYNIDMIGSWDKHHMGGNVPDPDFDLDHDGHSGWTFAQMLVPPDWDNKRGDLNTWIQTYYPDIVLLELGTNDVFQCVKVEDMISTLGKIVTILRTRNPNVRIALAQIPPLGPKWANKKYCGDGKTLDAVLREFNTKVAEYASSTTTSESPVIIVDQFTGIDPAIHQYDNIHPNDAGEKIMAERWFNAIQPYLKKLL